MATGPAEVFGRIDVEGELEFRVVCEAIETALAAHNTMENPRVWLSAHPRSSVRNRVIKEYTDAGWSEVKFGSDQTQGNWVELIR